MPGPGLSTSRTTANTPAEHVGDHNLMAQVANLLDLTVGPVLKSDVPVNPLDTAYGLTGTTDNTVAINAALAAAGAAQRGLHFPKRPGGDPYVVGGSGVILQIPAGVPSVTADPGVIIKVKNGNGDYTAMLSGPTSGTDLAGLVVAGLTFDQNSANNVITVPADLSVSGKQRFVIWIAVGDRLQVKDCRFANLAGANGLRLGQITSTMLDVRVQDCQFDAAGAGAVVYDHSTIHLTADGITVTGNTLRGTLGGDGAWSAIETHGANQVVTHNHVIGYRNGGQITGITDIGNGGVLIANNTFDDVLVGMRLWSHTGTNGGLRDVQIANNVIRIDRDAWQQDASSYPRGIMVEPSGTDDIDGLMITDNTIKVLPFAATALTAESNCNGIDVRFTTSTREVRNFQIDRNWISGTLAAGIRVDCKAIRGRVSNNTIVDPGSSTEGAMASAFKTGLLFVNDMTDVDVFDNRTVDTRGTHLVVAGVTTSISGAVTRCRQWNNSITCLDGVALTEVVQAAGKRFQTRTEPMSPLFMTGWYYGPQGGRATATAANGVLYLAPFGVGYKTQFVRIGTDVTTAGAASSVVRFAVFADDGRGLPGLLLLDGGTQPADAIASVENTISLWLPAGLYHVGLAAQGGAPVVRGLGGGVNSFLQSGGSTLATAVGASPYNGVTMGSVSGAIPSTFTLSNTTTACPFVVLRAA